MPDTARQVPSVYDLLRQYYDSAIKYGQEKGPILESLDSVTWSPISELLLPERDDGVDQYDAESVLFGRVGYSGGEAMILISAGFVDGKGWLVQQMSEMHLAPNDVRLKAPVLRMGMIGYRRAIVALAGSSPQLGSASIVLSSGRRFSSTFKGGGAIVFAPVIPSEENAREGVLEILDTHGSLVASDVMAVLSSGDPIA